MTYVIKNRQPFDVWVNLPNPEDGGKLTRGVRVPPRGIIQLTDEEYESKDVQAKIREDVLVLLKTI
jgi:hypothetical protein